MNAEHVLNLLIDEGGMVEYNGVRVDLYSAARSPDFITSLIKIGLVSLEKAAPGLLSWVEVPSLPKTLLMTTAYAIDVSPRIEGDDKVIDAGGVIAHAKYLTSRFVDPEIDPELIRSIGVLAQIRVNQTEGPEQTGAPQGGEER
jgi:hypothetical protein